MKTICVKTNNEDILEYLSRKLKNSVLEDIVISFNEFKNYKNIIIHYCGINERKFLLEISQIIADMIETFYEKKLLEKIIENNYFYFEEFEKEMILKISERIIEIQESNFKYKNEILKGLIYEYFIDNKYMILDGFVLFRLKSYFEILDYVVDTSVTNYVIGLQ